VFRYIRNSKLRAIDTLIFTLIPSIKIVIINQPHFTLRKFTSRIFRCCEIYQYKYQYVIFFW